MKVTSCAQHVRVAFAKCSSTQRASPRPVTARRSNAKQLLCGRVQLTYGRFLGDVRAFQPSRAKKIGANGPTRLVTSGDLNEALGLQPWQPGEIAGLVFFIGLSWATFSATTGVDGMLAQGNLEEMKEKGSKLKNQRKVGSGTIYELEDTN
eukprot:9496248-Pyramimonas_sp.AAC.2